MQNIFQLVYISYANDYFMQDEDSNIDDIINTAIEFNKSRGVTGILLHRKGIFLQLLEGDKENVLQLYGLIASDFRHGNIKTILKQYTNERIFKEWSMALKKVDQQELKVIDDIYPWDDLIRSSKEQVMIPKEKILKVLQRFYFPPKN